MNGTRQIKLKIEGVNIKTKDKRPKNLKQALVSTAFLSPSFIGVLIFFVLPFAVVIYYCMIDNPVNHEFVGFANIISVFKNSAFRLAAKNTALFSLISVPLAVILSLGLAVLLDTKIPLRSHFRTFFLSPMMVPVASVVLIWQVIFHHNGALNEFLSGFGFEKIDWMKSEYNRLVIIFLFLWKNLGYNMILFMAAINNIPKDLLEIAEIEGAGPVRKFFQIKLVFLSPTILFVTILSLINSFKVFRETYMLTGDYPYDGLYLLQHFMNNTFRSLDYQRLSAAAVMMAIVMAAIIGVMFLVEYKMGKDLEQ